MLRAAALCLLLGACSPKPTPPIIDGIDLPKSVTTDASGGFPVPITLRFHDDDDAVTLLRIQVPSVGMTYDDPLMPALLTGSIAVTLRFPSNTAKQAYELDFSLIDSSGLSSLVAKEMVTLQ